MMGNACLNGILDSIYGTLQGALQILNFWYGKNHTSTIYKAQLDDPYVAWSILVLNNHFTGMPQPQYTVAYGHFIQV